MAALSSWALLGCGSDVVSRTETHVVRDSAGVRIVESLAPAWEARRAIDPRPVLRVGGGEEGAADATAAEDALQFEPPVDGLFLRDGRIAVRDGGEGRVRIFDPRGRWLRSLEAPVRDPGALSRYRGDTLAVDDGASDRLRVVSSRDGGSRSVPVPPGLGLALLGAMADGSFLLTGAARARSDRPPGLRWDSAHVFRVGAEGRAPSLIATVPLTQRLVGEGGRRTGLELPAVGVGAAAGDGFHWAASDRWEIRSFDASGALRRISRRPGEPRVLDRTAREAHEAAWVSEVAEEQGEGAAFDLRRRLAEASYAPVVPLFGEAFVDGEGRLWVGRRPWPGPSGPPPAWSVFAEDGRWLGDVEAPPGVRVVDARGDAVLGVRTAGAGGPEVRVHRILRREP